MRFSYLGKPSSGAKEGTNSNAINVTDYSRLRSVRNIVLQYLVQTIIYGFTEVVENMN